MNDSSYYEPKWDEACHPKYSDYKSPYQKLNWFDRLLMRLGLIYL